MNVFQLWQRLQQDSFFHSIAGFSKGEKQPAPDYPRAKLLVLSDLHYFDAALGVEGRAFEKYIKQDRKLLREIKEIFQEGIRQMLDLPADILLIPGDLTKDGERRNHEILAQELKIFRDRGVKVFVIPGNHDIANHDAVRFEQDKTVPEPSVTPEEFARIYQDYGYGQALSRDPASLSYTSEPLPGFILLALDSCLYKFNPSDGHPITEGKIFPETKHWMQKQLELARKSGKAVVAMVHHGILEHWTGQRKLHAEYLLEHYQEVARLLADYDVRLVFTGHYHAQDVSMKRFGKKFIYDIETGSFVTYPCPFRHIQITADQKAKVSSYFVTRIPSHTDDFPSYSREFLESGMYTVVMARLRKARFLWFHLQSKEAKAIAHQVVRAFTAHYQGDEKAFDAKIDKQGISWIGRLVVWNQKYILKGLLRDLEPSDNFIQIDLRTGSWQ